VRGPARLDFADAAAVREWLVELHVYLLDVDALVIDMLRPLGQRELGRILHRDNYDAARQRIAELLAIATPPHADSAALDVDEPPWGKESGRA
jgi:hypothetical protein